MGPNKRKQQEHDRRVVNRGPRTCPTCNGKGFLEKRNVERDEDGLFDGAAVWDCDRCNKTGKIND
ncbi:hypothetical protein [Frankia sp. Cr2]|uniref:hypothetical protein n=1 Tax=Frankia sp. Cr2 TaxID=3073932 RepID=UPI002AD1D9EB|nr:hypothetical protein [Frankia sp. Cr2]